MPPSRDSESSSDSSDSESRAASRRPRRRSWSKQPFSDQPRFRLSTCPGQVRCRRGGVCLFRHRTAHKARRRTRATTSCRGGCCGLTELRFESLGARGGSQSPAHARETGPKRLATRRGGTRPTGVQYFARRRRLTAVHDFLDHFHQLSFAVSLISQGARIIVCDLGWEGGLNQDCQEQKGSSAALVPLEIPRKPWPCACLMST
jgi:hypothetical protein